MAEKAIRELLKELLMIQPEGGAISDMVLSEATAKLNSRIRAPGVSAHEVFTQRDQNTGLQLTLDDMKLIDDQHRRRQQHHAASELNKSGGRPSLPDAVVSVGSIVYIYSDGSKLRARPRYVVLKVKDGWCTLRRFAEKQLGRITYDVKLSECYVVPDEVDDHDLPTYREETVSDDDVVMPRGALPVGSQEAVPLYSDAEDSDSSSSSEEEAAGGADVEEEKSFCAICHRSVEDHHQGLLCDNCSVWQGWKTLPKPKNFLLRKVVIHKYFLLTIVSHWRFA